MNVKGLVVDLLTKRSCVKISQIDDITFTLKESETFFNVNGQSKRKDCGKGNSSKTERYNIIKGC